MNIDDVPKRWECDTSVAGYPAYNQNRFHVSHGTLRSSPKNADWKFLLHESFLAKHPMSWCHAFTRCKPSTLKKSELLQAVHFVADSMVVCPVVKRDIVAAGQVVFGHPQQNGHRVSEYDWVRTSLWGIQNQHFWTGIHRYPPLKRISFYLEDVWMCLYYLRINCETICINLPHIGVFGKLQKS